MYQFTAKAKLIFVPFLFISVATVGGYTFLHWLLLIKTNVFEVDEEIINLIAPLVLPWVPILIWIRPRIKLLNLKTQKKGDSLFGYMMVAWIAMAAPCVIAQAYVITATGKLTSLNDIGQIDKLPKTKYYTLKNFYIDKKLARVKSTFEVSGKYNEHFDMTIFAPCPIFEKNHSADTASVVNKSLSVNSKNALIVVNGKVFSNSTVFSKNALSKITPNAIKSITVLKGPAAVALYGAAARDGAILIQTKDTSAATFLLSPVDGNAKYNPIAWIALKYQKTIGNRLSPEEKESEYKEFAATSQQDFNAKSLNDFVYLDRIGASGDLKNYSAAVKTKDSTLKIPVIVLSPVNEPFEARNGKKLPWIFGSFGIGAAIFLISLLFKPLREEAFINAEEGEAKEDASILKQFKLYFLLREGFYITPIIIDLNLIVFIVMVFAGLGFVSFNGPDLLKWGANYRPLVVKGEYWRLLTNIFLHEGFMHILLNMCGLLFAGIFLEPIMGKKRYVLSYLGTGIIASIVSIWWHPATVSIGASGAIFGMYGIFFALLTTSLFPPAFKKPFLINTAIFIGYNLLFGLVGGIDNAAHLGGLLSGLIIGYALYPALKAKASELEAQKEITDLIDGFRIKN